MIGSLRGYGLRETTFALRLNFCSTVWIIWGTLVLGFWVVVKSKCADEHMAQVPTASVQSDFVEHDKRLER